VAEFSDPAAAGSDAPSTAVEQARAAAVDTAGSPDLVGEHLGAVPETSSALPVGRGPRRGGHPLLRQPAAGLRRLVLAVTLARVPGEEQVTVDEVVLLPGEQALLAPAWVPWHERLRPGDLSVGDVLPSTEDDPRLVPSYTTDDDSADDPEGSVVASEVGLGRERVMSQEGRAEAAARWDAGEFGPRSAMARQAPGPCGTCGFFLPLAGSLRHAFGACGNVYAPADGRVVAIDYGCGAHSQATLVADDATEVVRSARYDTGTFDVLSD
jgi:hypothetical protein